MAAVVVLAVALATLLPDAVPGDLRAPGRPASGSCGRRNRRTLAVGVGLGVRVESRQPATCAQHAERNPDVADSSSTTARAPVTRQDRTRGASAMVGHLQRTVGRLRRGRSGGRPDGARYLGTCLAGWRSPPAASDSASGRMGPAASSASAPSLPCWRFLGDGTAFYFDDRRRALLGWMPTWRDRGGPARASPPRSPSTSSATAGTGDGGDLPVARPELLARRRKRAKRRRGDRP